MEIILSTPESTFFFFGGFFFFSMKSNLPFMKLFKVEFVTNLISCAAGACCGTASAKSCAEDEFGDFFSSPALHFGAVLTLELGLLWGWVVRAHVKTKKMFLVLFLGGR